jgi:hypothetical protein
MLAYVCMSVDVALLNKNKSYESVRRPGSSVGITTELRAGRSGDRIPVERFSARPDRSWDPPSFLYNKYRLFPGGELRPGRESDHSPLSSVEVLAE